MQLKRSINVRKNSFICQENVISFGRKLNNGLDRMEKWFQITQHNCANSQKIVSSK